MLVLVLPEPGSIAVPAELCLHFRSSPEHVMAKSPGSGSDHLGSDLPLPLCAVWPRGGDFTSLCLIFPTWKMGVRR